MAQQQTTTTRPATAQTGSQAQLPPHLQTADSGRVRLGGGCHLPQPRR